MPKAVGRAEGPHTHGGRLGDAGWQGPTEAWRAGPSEAERLRDSPEAGKPQFNPGQSARLSRVRPRLSVCPPDTLRVCAVPA